MATLSQEIKLRSVTAIGAYPNINRLNTDVLHLIFQEVIDVDISIHTRHVRWLSEEPKAAIGLSLVCKRWRNIVFSTPSFWPIINLTMLGSAKRMQVRLDLLANRAKNAPVDLHIEEVHSHAKSRGEFFKYHSGKCCCKFGGIRLDFSRISNIRCLRVQFRDTASFSLLDTSALPSLKHVKEAEFYVTAGHSYLTEAMDLENFLRLTPDLLVFRLNRVGIHDLQWASADNTLMRNLQTLIIGAGCLNRHDNLPHLSRILSHAPNLEELGISVFEYFAEETRPLPTSTRFSESIKCFPNLRKVDTDGFTAVNWLFTDSGVAVPNLQEFSYVDRNHPNRDHNDAERFFSAHKSIKTVSIDIAYDPASERHLRWATEIEELNIQVHGRGKWLNALCTPRIDENTGLAFYICPHLCVITVVDCFNSIPASCFEDFVRVRCQPIDEGGCTVAGCRAIEVLNIEYQDGTGGFKALSATEAWKTAEVRRLSDQRYEFRWTYRPEQVSIGVEMGDAENKANGT